PLVVYFEEELYFPVYKAYPETTLGGELATEAEYGDPYIQQLINASGWAIRPPIRYHYHTIKYELGRPAPSPPSRDNWLGTDDQARDVLARLIDGFRISVLFGLALTIFSSVIGVAVGAIQGYFGGWVDLF